MKKKSSLAILLERRGKSKEQGILEEIQKQNKESQKPVIQRGVPVHRFDNLRKAIKDPLTVVLEAQEPEPTIEEILGFDPQDTCIHAMVLC
jgi:hypothetical protein